MTELDGLLLVSSSSVSSSSKSSLSTTINEDNNIVSNVWRTTVPLSFWGGIDPIRGIVIDETHPWMGRCVSGAIIILPSGRGSCTASQVLWELIRNQVAPRAIVLRDLDGQMCIGAIVAQQLLSTIEIQQEQEQQYPTKETQNNCHWIPDILHLGVDAFETCMNLPDEDIQYGIVTSSGKLLLGNSQSQVTEQLQTLNQNSENKEQNTIHQKHAHFSSLTDEENAMLDAAATNAERMALEVLIRYAHIVSYPHTPTYVPIQAAHIDACTYIGPGGLEFATRLVQAGGQVKVPTTLNAGSCDRHRWKALGVPENYAQPSLALGDAYVALGCQPTFTCAPYLLLQNQQQQQQQQHPYANQDLGWGESNAVVYANSVWGARTEKYADYLDICVALVGKTVQIGVHVAENRRPQILLDATNVLKDISTQSPSIQDIDSLFPILGHLCGTLSDGLVPMLLGLETWAHVITTDHLKAFCAAFGTTGTSPLIHIAGITPEARDMFAQQQQQLHESMDHRRIEITWEDVKKTYTTLDSSSSSSQSEIIDLVALGNPHLSIPECHLLSQLVQGSRKHDSVRVIACMSRSLYEQIQTSDDDSITKNLEQFGVEFIHDTCWCMLLDPPVLPPLSQTSKKRNSTILTNSGKYAHYGPGLTQRQYRFGSWNNCIEAAITGKYLPLQQPSWLLLRPSSSKRQFVSWTQTSLRQIIRRMKR